MKAPYINRFPEGREIASNHAHKKTAAKSHSSAPSAAQHSGGRTIGARPAGGNARDQSKSKCGGARRGHTSQQQDFPEAEELLTKLLQFL